MPQNAAQLDNKELFFVEIAVVVCLTAKQKGSSKLNHDLKIKTSDLQVKSVMKWPTRRGVLWKKSLATRG